MGAADIVYRIRDRVNDIRDDAGKSCFHNFWEIRHKMYLLGLKINILPNPRAADIVIEYPKAASPMLIGFCNHILVLPKEQYNSEELFFILKHELVHLKRGDV